MPHVESDHDPAGSEAVTLREVEPDDLPILFEHQNDPLAAELAAFASRDEEAFFPHWQRILADPTVHARAVLLDNRVVGNLVSFVQDGEREVGYWIARDAWGRGIATRALAQFLTEISERPLYAHVAEHNPGSRRVLEKCGFVTLGDPITADDGVVERVLWLQS
jgi:RimJ/RimL family protein N-acetyltransferase